MAVASLLTPTMLLLASPAAAQKPVAAPEGFIEMQVAGVIPSPDGNVLVLTDLEETLAIPITIGMSEAMAIVLRQQRKRFERPLTHDLLETMVGWLGGEVVQVRIDDLKNDTYVATVDLRRKGRMASIDARASDAVVLALGRQLPVYVALHVVRASALKEPEEEDAVIRL